MPDKRKITEMNIMKYDRMNIDELEELMRQDALLSDMNEAGLDEIVHIMDIVAERKRTEDPSSCPDTEKAKASFDENYLPLADSGELLYELGRGEEQKRVVRKNGRRKLLRTVIMAAVMSVILIVSLIAYAGDFDLWDRVTWTRGTFFFADRSADMTEETDIDERLSDMREKAEALLKCLPDDYEKVDSFELADGGMIEYSCMLSNGTDNIALDFVAGVTEAPNTYYAKDEMKPVIVTINGIDCYLLSNNGKNSVIWTEEGIDCSVVYTDVDLNIIDILSSIGGL